MTRLTDLCTIQGQSPWIDNLRRDYVTQGHLAELVALGVRGVTSNPTIMAKAIEAESDDGPGSYLDQLRSLGPAMTTDDAYWELVIRDIEGALDLLAPVHAASNGKDGFVSLEVDPQLAHDTPATVTAARAMHERIRRPNLFVKVPATREGVPAIRELVGEGHNINVTLIFSIERYAEVCEAYIGGLELLARDPGADLASVHGVASFFVSRIDTEVDRRIEDLADRGGEAHARMLDQLRGTAAVAQAKTAYAHFRRAFSGPRWEALAARGANVQRPLWASTSTKNPAYADLVYVDNLIAPDTVNTMPDATLEAFLDHGTIARTVDADADGAQADLDALAQAGVDLADVADTLEKQGVSSFATSFTDLLVRLADQRERLFGTGGTR